MKRISRSVGILFVGFALSILITHQKTYAQNSGYAIKIATVKYNGGGDWYQGQTPLPNFIQYVRANTLMDIDPKPEVVELNSDKLFSYPFLFLSGHGNITLSDREAENLRRYLEGGGFLYIDDDYGLDQYIRREMKKVFPGRDFVELPFDHPIYHTQYSFNGPPKIHEHDNKPPQGFGILIEDRLAVYYTYETNFSDGWEPAGVHPNTPAEKREQALRMGANILAYALMN